MNERESREHKRLPHTSLPFAAQSLARASQPKRQLRLATQATGKTCSVDLRMVFDLKWRNLD